MLDPLGLTRSNEAATQGTAVAVATSRGGERRRSMIDSTPPAWKHNPGGAARRRPAPGFDAGGRAHGVEQGRDSFTRGSYFPRPGRQRPAGDRKRGRCNHRRRQWGLLRCRPYGGVVVKWHGLMAIVWLVWWGVVASGEAARRSRGSRRLVVLIFGGWVPQDLCSSHVRCLKSSAPAGGWVLRRRIAELCARAGECSGRLASRNGLSA